MKMKKMLAVLASLSMLGTLSMTAMADDVAVEEASVAVETSSSVQESTSSSTSASAASASATTTAAASTQSEKTTSASAAASTTVAASSSTAEEKETEAASTAETSETAAADTEKNETVAETSSSAAAGTTSDSTTETTTAETASSTDAATETNADVAEDDADATTTDEDAATEEDETLGDADAETDEEADAATTRPIEEVIAIMDDLNQQIGDLAAGIEIGLNMPDDTYVIDSNIIELEDGSYVGLLHVFYFEDDGNTWQAVFSVSEDGEVSVAYTTPYQDVDMFGDIVTADNALYDEFFYTFMNFYDSLGDNAIDYGVYYCGTYQGSGVNPTMYVGVEFDDGSYVYYAIDQYGMTEVVPEDVPTLNPPEDLFYWWGPCWTYCPSVETPAVVEQTVAIVENTESTPQTGDTTTMPAVALGLTMTAAGAVAFVYRKKK